MPLLSPKTANYQADIFSILPKTYSFRKRTMLRQAQHKSLTPSRSKPCPVWHPLPFDHHGYFYPLQQPTLPCDSKNQRRSPAMTCPRHRPPGQVCLLKWTPNLFPRNSCRKSKDEFRRMKDEVPSTNGKRIHELGAVIRVFVEKIRGWSFRPTCSRVIPATRFASFRRESCRAAFSPFS